MVWRGLLWYEFIPLFEYTFILAWDVAGKLVLASSLSSFTLDSYQFILPLLLAFLGSVECFIEWKQRSNLDKCFYGECLKRFYNFWLSDMQYHMTFGIYLGQFGPISSLYILDALHPGHQHEVSVHLLGLSLVRRHYLLSKPKYGIQNSWQDLLLENWLLTEYIAHLHTCT